MKTSDVQQDDAVQHQGSNKVLLRQGYRKREEIMIDEYEGMVE
jgi:hypothetical protein